jgi:putative transposase
MPILTLTAKIIADEPTAALLREAMLAATKVYNGLLWQLRQEYEATGQSDLRRGHLNGILKTLPRAKEYYSLSAQATRDEVIGAYHSFFALRAAGRTQHQAPGFRRKTAHPPLRYYNSYGFTLAGDRLT